MGSAKHAALTGDLKGSYGILVERSERKRPLERPRRRWENNIKVNLQEME
jgi:hypothetical protein